MEVLQFLVYLVFAVAVISYASLDGFDLGVGCLHLFAKNDRDRRIFLNAIGPVWDGNSVWIVISVGLVFAGFPPVFAAITSGFYLPSFLVVAMFMFRAASLEFRSKTESPRWRSFWDFCFFASSVVMAFDLGMILGNMAHGVPLDTYGDIVQSELNFFNGYAISIGALGTLLFSLHGALYLLMKTEGELQKQIRGWMPRLLVAFLLLWVIATAITFMYESQMLARMHKTPWLWAVAFFSLASFGAVVRNVIKENYGYAFISSMIAIALFVALFCIGTYPYLLFSSINSPENSMTIYNSSSSFITLLTLIVIAATGVPLFYFYASYVYRTFRGKVKIGEHSY
jgi:cytochrome bd ubiquinol oxidase subunit II